MYTVYMHTCLITGKKYIGITCQQPYERRFNGDGSGYKHCTYFYHAIQKYGWENFVHKVLTTCETEKEAMALERKFIAQYKTRNPEFGYNIREGGEHQEMPQETKDKIKDALKGRPLRGYGWKHTPETIEKIRNAQKGRPLTPEHAEHSRRATREYYKTHSPVHTFTEEDYAAARAACQIKVRVVETGEIFNSMSECADHFGVLISNLSRAIKHNKKYKGLHFEKVCS